MNQFEIDIKKAQTDRVSAILSGFKETDSDTLEKGKKANIGEIREWSGKRYKKQPNGKWVEVSEKELSKKEHEKYAKKI